MTRKRPRPKLRYRRVALLAVLLASFVFLGATIGFVAGAIRNMPNYDINNITGALSSFVLDKDDQVVTSLKTDKNRVQLEPDEIPLLVKQAIISIEDQRFLKHRGIDLYRLGGAFIANITEGYGSQGGSTITQQLVKNAILENPEKKMRRKVQELIIALRVEKRYTKEQILTMYLNNVYYGHRAWSLQTASQTYFGKDAKDLDLSEAAMLAGVINAPGRYSPYLNPEKAAQRQALVLKEMVKMGYITQEQSEAAKNKPLKLAGLTPNDYKYQSFLDFVIEECADKLQLDNTNITELYTAGYRIYTTMDVAAQDAAEEVFSDKSFFPPNKDEKMVQSALVILDPHTGSIRSLIGGRNQEGERQFNRATHATRQPGSAFKPVAVYGPALEKGYSPATVLDDYLEEYDTPMGPKTFVNYDGKYRGLISMRTAIQYSVNTVAVKMLQKIGVNEGFNFATGLGITSLVDSGSANDMGLSLALGGLTKGVSPLELTAAYGAFANGGIYVKPYVIRKIEDLNGNVLYENKPYKSIAMSPQTAYLMSDMLQTAVQSGTGQRAQLADRPVAGKTGTTSYDVDAWFVGFTPDLVGSVWLGFDKVERMNNVYGGGYGAPIWKKVMEVAHRDIAPSTFPVPENIASMPVDYKSGLLPSSITPKEYIVIEKFNSAYLPTETSSVWVQMPVCAESGQLLSSYCPYSLTRTFLKRPIPWTGSVPPEDAALETSKEYCSVHGGGKPNSPNSTSLELSGAMFTDTNSQNRSIKLSWNYLVPEHAVPVIQIYRSSQGPVYFNSSNMVAEIKNSSSSWTDYQVKDGTAYHYRLKAVDGLTGSQLSLSNEIVVRNPQNITLNAPHLTGEAFSSNNKVKVKLSWSKPAEYGNFEYQVYRSEKPDFKLEPQNRIDANQLISQTTFFDKNLPQKDSYYYRVVGIEKETGRQSPPSNVLQVITP